MPKSEVKYSCHFQQLKSRGTYTLGRRLQDPRLHRWHQEAAWPPEQMWLGDMKKGID